MAQSAQEAAFPHAPIAIAWNPAGWQGIAQLSRRPPIMTRSRSAFASRIWLYHFTV